MYISDVMNFCLFKYELFLFIELTHRQSVLKVLMSDIELK